MDRWLSTTVAVTAKSPVTSLILGIAICSHDLPGHGSWFLGIAMGSLEPPGDPPGPRDHGRPWRWRRKVGVELGAGLGLPAIVAAKLGAQVVATEP